MVFSDLFFLFVFIPCFMLCYMLGAGVDRLMSNREMRTMDCKNAVLVFFSLVFYAWGEPVYVFLMLGCVLVNYVAGRCIAPREDPHWRKVALWGGLAFNIAVLGVFKYAGFLTGLLNDCGLPIPIPRIALPIGISFYTFQSISYLVDVYWRKAEARTRFMDLLLYISMFPQLIAGPIVRFDTIANEISNRRVSAQDFSEGAYRFFIGLGKKVIIANQFSEVVDQFLLHGMPTLTTTGAWVGVLAFTLQIYFDFSGYSDMAIGMGRCMGFHFNENFRHPYCCNSITDFWRRWHISLGSFFRDYVYIPLGGNRRHQPLNILVVWFITGLWHGASWNFVLWGLYFGVIVMLEKFTILKLSHWIFLPFRHVYALAVVVIGWGIFYFDDFGHMARFFTVAFGEAPILHSPMSEAAVIDRFWLWVAALLFCLPIRSGIDRLSHAIMGNGPVYGFLSTIVRTLATLILLVGSVALLVGATNNAFIYTRF